MQTDHPPIRLDAIIDSRPSAGRESGQGLNFDQFCESLRRLGTIQPLILEQQPDGTHTMVAGGRRRRGLMHIGHTELFHASSCDPERPGYLFAHELSEADRLEVELDENIQRLNIGWQEEVMQIVRVHEARSRSSILKPDFDPKTDRWTELKTGALLNVSAGHVNNTLKVAAAIRAGDKDILAATSFAEALRVFMQRKVDEANAKLVKDGVASTVNTKVPPNVTTDSTGKPTKRKGSDVVVIFDDEDNPESSSRREGDLSQAPGMEDDGKVTTIPLSTMLHLGPLETVVPEKFPDNFFDFGLVDIPYGIDLANMNLKQQSRVDKEHDVLENAALMPIILKEYYRTLRDGTFLCMCYDLDYHERLRTWAEDVGFKVQRWPRIWHKTHPCKNNSPQYNSAKNYEVIYVFRKGNVTINKPQTSSIISCDGQVEAKMYDNPFAKPFDMWKWLIDDYALPGMKVGDFCCGEGSSLRAAIMCGLMPYGVEISELHYNPCVENIKSAYTTLTKGKVEFT